MGSFRILYGFICLFFSLSYALSGVAEEDKKKLSPPNKDGKPVKVESSMFILDVSDINDKTMEFTSQFYFRQQWKDERLQFEGSEPRLLTTSEIDEIWKPDLFFIQERRGQLHSITVPNIFARVKPDGTIRYSMRLTMTFQCSMDLRYYPHDSHSCKFQIESYGLTAEHVMLTWEANTSFPSISMVEEMSLPDFEVSDLTYNEDLVTLSGEVPFKYSRLSVELTFQRKLGFFLMKIFVPYILLVITSWLAFWIHPRFIIQRLSILLSILMLMTVIAMDLSSNIPESPYIKGIDVWTGFCISLVFAAFLEFIYVSIEAKKERSNSSDKAIIVSELGLEKNEKSSDEGKFVYFGRQITSHSFFRASNRMDSLLRVVYPIMFAFFNLVYWCYYAA